MNGIFSFCRKDGVEKTMNRVYASKEKKMRKTKGVRWMDRVKVMQVKEELAYRSILSCADILGYSLNTNILGSGRQPTEYKYIQKGFTEDTTHHHH